MAADNESNRDQERGSAQSASGNTSRRVHAENERDAGSDRRSAMSAESDRGSKSQADGTVGDNTVKDPDDWKSGEEPMTGAQRSYLKTLSDEAKEPADENLTKAEASKRIDELRERLGR